MKLLFQADDYGLTESTTCGILKGIRSGIIRNTGLFINMPASAYAASQIKHYPEICFGQDINLVAGKPISNPTDVPSLIDEQGDFITSTRRMKEGKLLDRQGIVCVFEKDPYPYDEVLIEIEQQVKKFIEVVGRIPGYLHGHSLSTPNTKKAMEVIAQKYDIIQSYEAWDQYDVYRIPCDWNPKPFPFEVQLQTDVEANLLEALNKAKDQELCSFICHAGFLEKDLFQYSTYTAIRMMDLYAATSIKIKEFIANEQIELITYDDLKIQ